MVEERTVEAEEPMEGRELTEGELEEVVGGIIPADQAPGPDPATPGDLTGTAVGEAQFGLGPGLDP